MYIDREFDDVPLSPQEEQILALFHDLVPRSPKLSVAPSIPDGRLQTIQMVRQAYGLSLIDEPILAFVNNTMPLIDSLTSSLTGQDSGRGVVFTTKGIYWHIPVDERSLNWLWSLFYPPRREATYEEIAGAYVQTSFFRRGIDLIGHNQAWGFHLPLSYASELQLIALEAFIQQACQIVQHNGQAPQTPQKPASLQANRSYVRLFRQGTELVRSDFIDEIPVYSYVKIVREAHQVMALSRKPGQDKHTTQVQEALTTSSVMEWSQHTEISDLVDPPTSATAKHPLTTNKPSSDVSLDEVQLPEPGQPIDINSAPIPMLLLLPGMTVSLAEALVQARQETGGFETYDEIEPLLPMQPHQFSRLKRESVLLPPMVRSSHKTRIVDF